MLDLGTLGGTYSSAYGINDSGQVVGYSNTAGGDYHAFLYDSTAMTDLGTLGGTYSYAYGINDSGQVVGYSGTIGHASRAFLYNGTAMTDLGTLGGTSSYAYSINNSGQVVGQSYTSGGDRRGFLYDGTVGMLDLNDLIPPDSGCVLSDAYAINSSGQIAGNGDIGEERHAFLLTPVSGPSILGYEQVRQIRISRTEFEYSFRVKAKNLQSDMARHITLKLDSVPANISVVNDKVFFASLPGGQEVLSEDTFTVRIDHSIPANENDLVWEVSDHREPYLPGDIDRNYMVNFGDVEFLAYNWLRSSVSRGLTGYWKFDEPTGIIAADSSGNTRDGVLNGGLWRPSSGVVDGSLELDGDDYVVATGYKGVLGSSSRTCAAWIKTENTGIFMYWGIQAASSKWAIFINNTVGWGGATGALRVSVGAGRVVATTDLRDNQWHHIAIVLADDGSPTTGEIKFYVDGVLEVNSYTANDSINTTDDSDLLIGSSFTGLIDEVRIYDRDLTLEEIQLLYNNPSDDPNYEGVGDLFDLSDLADIARHWQMQN